MPRLARLTVTLLAFLAVCLTSFQAAAAGNRSVLHFGDSLAVGTGIYLGGFLPGWSVRSSTGLSRHAADAPSALRALGPALPRVVVLSVGTNDDPGALAAFRRVVTQTVAVAGPSRCVVWSTIVRPPYQGVSYTAYNGALRAAGRRHANLVVLDWAAMAEAHPGWFGPDGVHPSLAGYRARARAIARLVEKGC